MREFAMNDRKLDKKTASKMPHLIGFFNRKNPFSADSVSRTDSFFSRLSPTNGVWVTYACDCIAADPTPCNGFAGTTCRGNQ